MTTSPNITLAIAPGKREFGIAVFSGADLTYASVKTLRSRETTPLLKEISKILQSLFRVFPIREVAAKAISQYQKLSPDLEGIVECIKQEAASKNLRVVEITIEQIKTALCREERSTERRAFENLLKFYPELERFWNRPNKWQNDYYAFLFSAVAVGAVYLKAFSDRNQPENHFAKSGDSFDTAAAAPEF